MMMRTNKRDWNTVSSAPAKIDISHGQEPKSFSGRSMHHVQIKMYNGCAQQRVMQVNEDCCYFSDPVEIDIEMFESMFDLIRCVKRRSSDNAE
jgi:hypothetical protein